MNKLVIQRNRRPRLINAKTIGFSIAFAIVSTLFLITG
jgi:hypothetical protein